MSESDRADMADAIRLLIEADLHGRIVRVTIRASGGRPKRLMEGRPVSYRLSHRGRSVVLAGPDPSESTIALDDIECVELV